MIVDYRLGTQAKPLAYESLLETRPTVDVIEDVEEEEIEDAKTTLGKRYRSEKGKLDERADFELMQDHIVFDRSAYDPKKRQEIATQLVKLAKIVKKYCGTVRLATSLMLLRKELVAAQGLLLNANNEKNYLSIVVHIDIALSHCEWKAISEHVMAPIVDCLKIGQDPAPVTYNDFLETFKRLNALGFASGPPMDLSEDEDQED